MLQRTIDIAVALSVLLVLMPLLVVIAVAIVVCSPGNPFYRGPRVGRGGSSFRIWKFRTMVPNATSLGPGVTGRGDPRVTPMGKLLRKTKLDELPQFLNVLAGDMTLVGPRPEAPEFVAFYNERQRAVLSVKPGITGPVQLQWADESMQIPEGDSARYYVDRLMSRKIEADLEYLANRTLLSDVGVVWTTAALVFVRVIAAATGTGLNLGTAESRK